MDIYIYTRVYVYICIYMCIYLHVSHIYTYTWIHILEWELSTHSLKSEPCIWQTLKSAPCAYKDNIIVRHSTDMSSLPRSLSLVNQHTHSNTRTISLFPPPSHTRICHKSEWTHGNSRKHTLSLSIIIFLCFLSLSLSHTHTQICHKSEWTHDNYRVWFNRNGECVDEVPL